MRQSKMLSYQDVIGEFVGTILIGLMCFIRCASQQFTYSKSLSEIHAKHARSRQELLLEHEAELARQRKLYLSAEENHRLEVRALEERARRLTSSLDSESALRRLSEDRAAQCDTATENLRRVTDEVKILIVS